MGFKIGQCVGTKLNGLGTILRFGEPGAKLVAVELGLPNHAVEVWFHEDELTLFRDVDENRTAVSLQTLYDVIETLREEVKNRPVDVYCNGGSHCAVRVAWAELRPEVIGETYLNAKIIKMDQAIAGLKP